MPGGLKTSRPRRRFAFAGSLTREVTTPLATASLFWAEQVLPSPVQSVATVQEANGACVQFFGALASKFLRLPSLRRDSRSSVSSPEGGGIVSTKLDAHALW